MSIVLDCRSLDVSCDLPPVFVTSNFGNSYFESIRGIDR